MMNVLKHPYKYNYCINLCVSARTSDIESLLFLCLLFSCIDVAYCFVNVILCSSAACSIICTVSPVLLYLSLLLLFCCIVVLCFSPACFVLAREVPASPLVWDHRELSCHQAAEGVAAGVEAVSGQGGQASQADDDEGEEEVPQRGR